MSNDLLELSVAAAAANMSTEEFTAAFIKLGLEVWIPQEGFMQVMIARVKQLQSEAIPESVSPPKGALPERTYSRGEAQKALKVDGFLFAELRKACGIPKGNRSSPRLTEKQLGQLREALGYRRRVSNESDVVFTTLRRCVKEFHVRSDTLREFKRELGIQVAKDGKLRGITKGDYEKLKERVLTYKNHKES